MESSYQATNSSYEIYTGFWTDWSHGPTFGVTLTLNRRDGTLLIALLALFVSVVGTSFWRISCFVLHQLLSTEVAQDALHHQRQAIFRNAANGTSGLWSFLSIFLAWRQKLSISQTCRRVLPFIVFALCCITGFAAAGTFSSKISSALGDEVLVRSPTCGILDSNNYLNGTARQTYFYPYTTQMLSSYENYADDCYDNVSGLGSCNAFIKADIPTKIDTNASCPFGDDICKHKDGNIVFDTGYLDSHLDFGINAPPNERIQFRRVSSCAPIKTDGYRKSYRLPDSNNSYSRYYYGDSHVDYSDDLHTYEYPEINWDTQTSGQDVNAARTDYTIYQSNAFVLNGSYASYADFLPIPALRKMDADLHLMYLSSNMIGYSEEVDDPWFSAHVDKMKWYNPVNSPDAPPDTLYTQDEPVSVLACYVSEQYCNPNLPADTRCSPVGGISESAFLADGLWQNKRHQRMFRWFASIITASGVTLDVVPGLLGDAALTARHGLQLGHSGPLPDNQWQLEVEHWHRTSLVATQAIIADTAKGISDMHLEPWLVRPNDTEEKHLCNSQKIRNAEYFNFSVFGLAFTLALGSLIIVLSYVLEPILGWVQRRRSWDTYARLEWITNETLQLQRLAHEEVGLVKWEDCAENVPVTEKGEKLAVLDLHDLEHPRLKAPPRTFAGV